MLYLGQNLVRSIGNRVITRVPTNDPKYIGSVHIKNTAFCCLSSQTSLTVRDPRMGRIYDLLNYNNRATVTTGTNILSTAPGGYEVEMTVESDKDDGTLQTLFGAYGGTSTASAGGYQAAQMGIGASKKATHRVSNKPGYVSYGESLIGRKVTIRQIVLPSADTTYHFSYTSRLIVTDADTGEVLTDETAVFGNDATSKDGMTKNANTFYRWPFALFYLCNAATPGTIPYGTGDFEGYFWGGKIYINPTGADTSIPTRIPVHVFTPVKAGRTYHGSGIFSDSDMTYTPQTDWVSVETMSMTDFDNGIYNISSRLAALTRPTTFAQYSEIKYID